jgi:hypothetical protein
MFRAGGPVEVTESGLALPLYDYVSNAPTATTDVFSFKLGGASGLLVATVTLTFTDATKATLSTVVKAVPV